MSRVGYNHLDALVVVAALMVASDYHQTCQLTVSAGTGIECEVTESGYLRQHLLQPVFRFERSLDAILRLQRVQVGEVMVCGCLLVDGRIVLHCA